MEVQNYTFSNSSQYSEEELPTPFLLAFFSIVSLESILAVVFNSLTIIAIFKFEKLQTIHHIWLCSLAGSDLSAGIGFPFSFVTYAIGIEKWNQWFILCKVNLFCVSISSLGNAVFTLMVSVDRYIYILHPLRYHDIMTWNRVVRAAITIWGLIVTFTLITFGLSFYHNTDKSTINYCFDGVLMPDYLNAIKFITVFLPALVSTGLYGKVAQVARRQRIQIQQEQERFGASFPESKQRKMTVTLGFTVILYILTTIPMYCIGAFQRSYPVLRIVIRCLGVLYKINTFIVPVFLFTRHTDFKNAIKKLLKIGRNEVDPIGP